MVTLIHHMNPTPFPAHSIILIWPIRPCFICVHHISLVKSSSFEAIEQSGRYQNVPFCNSSYGFTTHLFQWAFCCLKYSFTGMLFQCPLQCCDLWSVQSNPIKGLWQLSAAVGPLVAAQKLVTITCDGATSGNGQSVAPHSCARLDQVFHQPR